MRVRKNKLYWAKVVESAFIPTKEKENGWYDIYTDNTEEEIVILPHTNKLISTGVACAVSPKYRLVVGERGSNTKSTLIVMAGKIDSGYRGNIFVSLYNGNEVPVRITNKVTEVTPVFAHEKTVEILVPMSKAIAQVAVERVPKMKEKVIPYETLITIPSKRGIGKLGSSGK